MSLVGPRPCIPYETEHFKPHQFERFLVPQGITGLWQVTARANSTFGEALDMDVAYVRGWSLGLDLQADAPHARPAAAAAVVDRLSGAGGAPELWARSTGSSSGAPRSRTCAPTGCTCSPRGPAPDRRPAAPACAATQRRCAAVRALLAPLVLGTARAAYDGPMLLCQGTGVRRALPRPGAAAVPRPRPARRRRARGRSARCSPRASSRRAGRGDYYAAAHHLRPLALPGTPLLVEVHCRPEWPKWSRAPAAGGVVRRGGAVRARARRPARARRRRTTRCSSPATRGRRRRCGACSTSSTSRRCARGGPPARRGGRRAVRTGRRAGAR